MFGAPCRFSGHMRKEGNLRTSGRQFHRDVVQGNELCNSPPPGPSNRCFVDTPNQLKGLFTDTSWKVLVDSYLNLWFNAGLRRKQTTAPGSHVTLWVARRPG